MRRATRAAKVANELHEMGPSEALRNRSSIGTKGLNDLPGDGGVMPRGTLIPERSAIMTLRARCILTDDELLNEMLALKPSDRAAHLLGLGTSTVNNIWQHFQLTGRVLQSDRRGQRSCPLLHDEMVALRKEIQRIRLEDKHVVEIPDLQKWYSKTYDKKLSRNQFRYALKRMGFVFGKSRKLQLRKDAPCIRAKVAAYIKRMDELKKDPNVVFVFLDESYVNRNHTKGHTWYHPEDEILNSVAGPAGKGERLIMLTGITPDGILGFDRVHGEMGSLLVWQAKKSRGDYHDNMNSKNFMTWFETAMIPAVKAQYPGKKVVFVMDNAPYHCVLPDGVPNFNKLKRDELCAELDKRGVAYKKRGDPGVGGEWDRVDALRKLLKDDVELGWGGRIPYLVEHVAEQHKYEVVFTPPYYPELQPIELLWGNVKYHVANLFRGERSMRELEEHLLDAFHKFGTAEHCQKLIQHVVQYEDQYRAEVEEEVLEVQGDASEDGDERGVDDEIADEEDEEWEEEGITE